MERNAILSLDANGPATARKAPAEPDLGADALEALALNSLDDDKADDVVSIDLRGKSSVTDVMIIASGRSARHVSALADHLVRALKDAGCGRARVEGLPAGDWVLIDAGDIVVHLFRPEVRAFYNLEKLWAGDGVAVEAV